MIKKKKPTKRNVMGKDSTIPMKQSSVRARKSATKKRSRMEWWPDPDPMPAILKALGSATLRQDFLDRLDYYREDLVGWLEGKEEGEAPPSSARRLIERHMERTDGEFFDEVVVGSESSDIGLGYSVTLYARRRGGLIHYRSRDDNGGGQTYTPTKAPLEEDEIANLIGPETESYDYETEAELVASQLPEDSSDEEIEEAAQNYASHVTRTKVSAVSDMIRERVTSKVRRRK